MSAPALSRVTGAPFYARRFMVRQAMPFLIPLMLRIGVTQRYAKAAAWVSAAILALLLAGLAAIAFTAWVKKGQKRAVEADRLETIVDTQNRTIAADRAAETAKQARDEVSRNEQEELRVEAKKGDATAVGPGTAAVYERLRRQQADRNKRAAH